MSIQVQDIGRSDYREAWDYQDELFKKIVDIKLANRNSEIEKPRPGYFLFTEHNHVYTLGKSGDLSNLLLSEEQLEKILPDATAFADFMTRYEPLNLTYFKTIITNGVQ